MIRYLTAGESHGKGLTVIIDGMPSNLAISAKDLDSVLSARQQGYGRGGRQKIEKDRVEILSGIRAGKTTGAPICLFVKNNDFANWAGIMSAEGPADNSRALYVPRPGHADLSGGMKYGQKDFRNVLERASARETAARVLAGAVAGVLLAQFGVEVFGYVINIGGIETGADTGLDISGIKGKISASEKKTGAVLRVPDAKAAAKMVRLIDETAKAGDTAGGIIKVTTSRLPAGLGDYTQHDRKLDGKIAAALMSIQAIKGVEFGAGFDYPSYMGSAVHDKIYYSKPEGFFRRTNNAGGIEGGMTTGEPISVKAAMKPISTVLRGIDSVDVRTKKKVRTVYERSDVCAVPAASVVAQSAVAFELANAFLESFGTGDMANIRKNHEHYIKNLSKY